MVRRAWLILVPVAAALAAFLSGCGDEQTAPPPRPPEVEVSQPVSDTLTDYAVFTGRTQAINAADLRARVTGYLEEVTPKQGEDVKKGDVLFVIQQKPFHDALAQAKATLEQQKAQLTYNEAVYQRNRVLMQRGNAVDMETLEQSRANRETSKAGVAAAEAAVALAQQNLDWSVIKAPFDGRISRRQVDPGNDVIADQTNLASLVQLDPLYAYFDVDERTLLQIRALLPDGKITPEAARRFPVTLGLANEDPEHFTHEGELNFADNKVDPSTGTLRMWGVFKNPRHDLYPNLFIRVRLGIGEPRPALFVAESALGSDQGRKYLYVVNEDNKVVYTPVEVGQRKNGLIAVEKGLQGGERLIVDGLQRVRPDTVVEAKPVPMPRAKVPAVATAGGGDDRH